MARVLPLEMSGVVDYFSLLGIERSAALDEERVRDQFRELSRECHPDSDGGDELRFAAINEAQRVLRSPATRIRHLLELEFPDGEKASAVMSDQLMAMFAELGGVFADADALIVKRRGASSAVAKALLAGEEVKAQQALMGAGGKVKDRRREIEEELSRVGLEQRGELERAAHELAFLEKWQREVQERVGALL